MTKYRTCINSRGKAGAQFIIEPFPGIRIVVEKIDTTDMAIARAKAEVIYSDIEKGISSIEEAGFSARFSSDLKAEDIRSGLLRSLTIRELGKAHIKSWENVFDIDTNEPMPLTDKNIVNFLDTFPFGDVFFERLTAPAIEVLAAKEE